MKKSEQLVAEIKRLKRELEELEKRLGEDGYPLSALEDFKSAIDQTRMTVWALLSALQSEAHEIAPAIVRFRMRRIVDMCRQLQTDINGRKVRGGIPELPLLEGTLRETTKCLERLQRTGA